MMWYAANKEHQKLKLMKLEIGDYCTTSRSLRIITMEHTIVC